MAHEVAKLLLEHAGTFLERTEAIKAALAMGMPLQEIEDYLEWMDLIKAGGRQDRQHDREPPEGNDYE